MLNLNTVSRKLKNFMDEEWSSLDFDYEVRDSMLNVNADLVINVNDEEVPVYLDITIGDSGLLWVDFNFHGGEVNLTMNSLMTVNEYNNGVGPFKAYVDDDGRLILSRPCLSIEDEDAFGPQIEDLLIEMVSDSNKEALAPLLALLA